MSTKSEIILDHYPCSGGVLAASTLSASECPLEPPGQPSLISDSLMPRPPRPAHSTMRLTNRDCDIIDLVLHTRALTDDQLRQALFPPGAASRCQLRLTLLYRNQYLDRLPRKSVNEPAVYLLTRRSVKGNRLMRERWGEQEFRRHMTRLGSLGHLLAVNDIRVRVERACRDLGWSLRLWQRPEELAPLLVSTHLVPDAYFQIQRGQPGATRTAAFFLELERAAKSSRVLRSKLLRYRELYYRGQYQQLFDTRALRVLFVFAAQDPTPTDRRIETGLDLSRSLGVTIARFVTLGELKSVAPAACLTQPVWRAPGSSGPSVLFADAEAGSPP